MKKTIIIDGHEVGFKATASTPRFYRKAFGRDIFIDMQRLVKDVKVGDEQESTLSLESLEVFENVAYIMAKQYDPTILPVDEWLDQFETFSIYHILPEIISLWNVNNMQIVDSKKK